MPTGGNQERQPVDPREYLARRLEPVNAFLRQAVADGHHPKVLEAIAYYPNAGGKRLRPILTVAVADAVKEGEGDRALPYGCALELVHNFTLVHDDVMDRDAMRRGRPTLHNVFGEAAAINAGDVLFALAFEVIAGLEVDGETLRTLLSETARTVFEIGEGQQWDMDFERVDPASLGEGDYLRMIEFKTARLFEQAARGGARIAGADERVAQELGHYARDMGIAFQIWDDYIDISADAEQRGKDVGSDIRRGKRTVMALHMLQNATADDRSAFLKAFGAEAATGEEVAQAVRAMERTGSVEHARHLAEKYATRAEDHLVALPPSEHREFLRALIYHMITRSY
jgi:geranylgeranyl diphosphate synthase type I